MKNQWESRMSKLWFFVLNSKTVDKQSNIISFPVKRKKKPQHECAEGNVECKSTYAEINKGLCSCYFPRTRCYLTLSLTAYCSFFYVFFILDRLSEWFWTIGFKKKEPLCDRLGRRDAQLTLLNKISVCYNYFYNAN